MYISSLTTEKYVGFKLQKCTLILSYFLFLLQYTPELLAQPELFKSIPDGQYLKVNVALIATLIYAGEY